MIPILYDASETAFTSNGIGRLTDCISCEVTEERNGIYELTMEYPMTGQHYADIMEGRIVFAPHDDTKDPQPFIIYRRSAPLNGIVTFDAYHLSYRLSEIAVQPFTAVSCPDAMSKIVSKSINTNPFTFDTSKTVVSPFEITVPRSVRSLLGGEQGSILDVYGKGEYEFDKWSVYLHLNRGQDRGVTIRYGKNLTDLTHEVDASGLYNAVIPYYQDEHDTVMLPEWYVTSSLSDIRAMVLDLSDEFDDVPSEQDLRDAATAALAGGMTPKENIEVSFIALWQTEEYKNFAALQRVLLCDTVTVEYQALGTSAKAQVIKVVYDAINERYTEMELGEAKKSLAQVIMDTAESAVMEKAASKGQMAVAIEYATQLIKGGYGGHVVIGTNADGEPNEIYIMDTADQATATDVIRMNVAGIGFSTTGIGGPYSSAWTIDGRFNADFIATGHLVADFIHGGTLTLGGINDQSGVLSVLDANSQEIGRWSRAGIVANRGEIGSWEITDGGLTSSGTTQEGSTYVAGMTSLSSVQYPDSAAAFVVNEWDSGGTYIGAPFSVNGNGKLTAQKVSYLKIPSNISDDTYMELRSNVSADNHPFLRIYHHGSLAAAIYPDGYIRSYYGFDVSGNSGKTGTFTAGGHTLTITGGIITGIS